MIDEGLWLVCYVSNGVYGHAFSELNQNITGDELVMRLKKEVGRDNLAITNMVRLGDLKND